MKKKKVHYLGMNRIVNVECSTARLLFVRTMFSKVSLSIFVFLYILYLFLCCTVSSKMCSHQKWG